ncbi:MAG: TIGR02466 family protein [Phreatobacter sp.]|uniref:TIGR02466 family protein n=1 Tax=Phreatobacter sp. TaxID=1966341 RepID=UPI0040355A86
MATIENLFVTRLYRGEIGHDDGLLPEIDQACRSLAVDDTAGIRWCRKNGYPGYTSYASLDDLPWRFPVFKALARQLDRHVAAFARDLALDLGGRKLVLDSLWVNVLPEGGAHASHIHPHSVISGTLYVAMPKGAAALKLEDPRSGRMMAHPPRKSAAARELQTFVSVATSRGDVLLWESFVRHEVPMNRSAEERISVSFNYRWG